MYRRFLKLISKVEEAVRKNVQYKVEYLQAHQLHPLSMSIRLHFFLVLRPLLPLEHGGLGEFCQKFWIRLRFGFFWTQALFLIQDRVKKVESTCPFWQARNMFTCLSLSVYSKQLPHSKHNYSAGCRPAARQLLCLMKLWKDFVCNET